MADRRKLQGEIERCLKKVSEGVETFEDIWKKVYNATNANQKEKYETDLKKEIKKLQRLRDQLKTWMSASDIKDKKNIQEARKRIEQQMERFKIVERETKTKAYSKEGLGAAQKLDPAQKEKDEINCWLTACINRLNIQLDKFESEIESVNFGLKKKKNDKEKTDRLEELKVRHGKHKFHINQLEALLRMLDNGTVEVDQIKKIKEDVEYYIDYAEDPDFQENEFMYDDLNLEDLEDYLAKQQSSYQQAQLDLKLASADEEGSLVDSTPTSVNSSSPSHSPSLGNHSSENSTPLPKVSNVLETNLCQSTSKEETASLVENSVSTEAIVLSSISVADTLNCQTVINSQSSTSYTSVSPSASNKPFKLSNNHESSWSTSTSTSDELSNNVNTKPFQTQISRSETLVTSTISSTKPSLSNSVWTDSKYSLSSEPIKKEDSVEKILSSKTESQLFPTPETKILTVNSQEPTKVLQVTVPVSMPSSPAISDSAGSAFANVSEQTISGISNHIRNFFPSPSNKDLSTTHNVSRNTTNDLFSETSCNNSPEGREVQINLSTIFGEIPPHSSPSNEEYLAILDRAKDYLPLPMDSQKTRYQSIGSCPMTVPDYYNIYISNCNTKEFFQRLSTETLFFIFYFLQGTKAQYFAARALKIKSWRFHTMFMMWFQRHEEPQKITDEYEQGTYIYFDYERWAQRKKEGFTFEYRYLEDKDFN